MAPTTAKVLVLGSPCSGKTALIKALCLPAAAAGSAEGEEEGGTLLGENAMFGVTKRVLRRIDEDQKGGGGGGGEEERSGRPRQLRELRERRVELRFWECNRLPPPPSSTTAEVLRAAAVAVVLYDPTEVDSYLAAVEDHYPLVKRLSPSSAVLLVASKSDLHLQRAVDGETVEEFAREEGVLHLAVSAKRGAAGVELLRRLVEMQVWGMEGEEEGEEEEEEERGEEEVKGEEGGRERVSDGEFVETFEKLQVEERDVASIEGILGRFRSPYLAPSSPSKTEEAPTGSAVLTSSIHSLHNRVRHLASSSSSSSFSSPSSSSSPSPSLPPPPPPPSAPPSPPAHPELTGEGGREEGRSPVGRRSGVGRGRGVELEG